jgi:hypothetical protein
MEEIDVNSRRKIQYSDNLEELISMAVADGKITDKEKRALLRRAMDEGIDPDEFEMVLESRFRDVSVEATDKGEVLEENVPILLHVCGKSADYGIGCCHNLEILKITFSN